MKKRMLAAVLAGLMMLTGAPVYAEETYGTQKEITANEIEENFEYRVNMSENTVTITGYMGVATDVVIPEIIDGMKVTEIGIAAFKGNTSITSVVIPEGVTTIGKYAFYYCTELVDVELPTSLTNIGEFAFYHSGLISIKVPETITIIKDMTFTDCKYLTEVILPYSLEEIGFNSFYGCESLKQIIIPREVNTIKAYAFNACTSLESVYFYGDIPQNIGYDTLEQDDGHRIFSQCSDDFIIYYSGNTSSWATPDTILGNYYYPTSMFSVENCEHSYKKITVKTSCEVDGCEKYVCNICGDQYVLEESIEPAFGHIYEIVEVVQATCTSDGYTHYKCIRCNDDFKDDVVSKYGHSYIKTDIIIEPTCEEEGCTLYKCSRCDATSERNYTDVIGHNWCEWAILQNPTDTETGLKERICSNCNAKQQIILHTLNSDHIYSAKVTHPTCTEQGYTIYTCSSCGYAYVGDYVEALGHDWSKEYTNKATCIKEGNTHRECEECGYEEILSTTPSLGHDFEVISTIEASCNKAGYDNLECTRCRELTVGNIVTVPHTASEWIIDEPATDTSEGWMHMNCAVCTYTMASGPVPRLLPGESSGYMAEDGLLKNVSPETTLADLTAQFVPEFGEVKIYTKNGAEVTDETVCIGTGCEIRLMLDNLVVSTLTIIVPGDIDGNGKMEQADANVLARLYAGWDCSAEIAHSLAADIDGDGTATRRDAMLLARRLAGWES